MIICTEFCGGVFCDISVPLSSLVYDPGPVRLSALMGWGLLVGSPLCECPLPLSSTTSALKTHYVQAPQDPQDVKLKLDSSYLYGNGSAQLVSDQLMTYSSIRVEFEYRLFTQFVAHAVVLLS